MAESGPNSASTIESDDTVGGTVWNNVSNAGSSNNSYASAASSVAAQSEYLKFTNFGFSIPTGSTILGIKVEAEKRKADVNTCQDNAVVIVKGGSFGSENKGLTSTEWPTTDTYVEYGGEEDLWSETWTAEDINSSNFGFAITVDLEGSGPTQEEAFVDHGRITVYYSEPIPVYRLNFFGQQICRVNFNQR